MLKKVRSIFLNKKNSKVVGKTSSSPVMVNVKLLEGHAVHCRCGSLAIPTAERGDTYQCIRCGKQPEGPKYNLGQREIVSGCNLPPKSDTQLLNMEFYDDAVELLKRKRIQIPKHGAFHRSFGRAV